LYCLPNIYLNEKIKKDETGGTCEKREIKINPSKFLFGET